MLGNLKSAEVDVDYWINALNRGDVTIATDGLVAAQRDYFATNRAHRYIICAVFTPRTFRLFGHSHHNKAVITLQQCSSSQQS
eukprot:12105729-Ditylum_brightwellii.AAC.1